MCLNVAEATAMIEAAKTAGKMLCVHHNRRHDGNYRLIKEITASGRIGEVYQVELTPAHYGNPFAGTPGIWWADASRSGGSFFYYGPQAIDWILDLLPYPISGVTGISQKLVWHEMTDEDQVTAIIRFENGAVGHFSESHIDASPRPFWRILGTKGAILDSGRDATKGYQEQVSMPSTASLELFTVKNGGVLREVVPYKDSDWDSFYRDVANHLLHGTPVPITGECGRRVIGVLEAAKTSCQTRVTESVPFR
jgi:predicted dehydrogenase